MAQQATLQHNLPTSWQTPLTAQRTPAMPLLLSGRGFKRDLEQAGALALFAPLEGGAETRLLRRLRAAGYRAQLSSARGLGDPEAFLFQLHGVRPPHLGHQSVGRGAAVGMGVWVTITSLMPLLPMTTAFWLLSGLYLMREIWKD